MRWVPDVKLTYTTHLDNVETPPDNYLPAWWTLIDRVKAKHGGYVTVTLETPRRPRSLGPNSQNHHFRGHCADIARESGCSPEFAAHAVKIWAVEQFEYPSQIVAGMLYPQSEADASVEEANMLIEAAHRLAAEYGYELREAE